MNQQPQLVMAQNGVRNESVRIFTGLEDDEVTPLVTSLSLNQQHFVGGNGSCEGESSIAVAGNIDGLIQDSPAHGMRPAKASVYQTALNIAKTCMGTGTLALPFAASQGGLVLNTVGIGLVAIWNHYSVDRLVKCLDLLPDENAERNAPSFKRHRRTASQMRRLFRGLRSKRVVIEGRGTEDEGDEEDRTTNSVVPPEGTATFGKVAWHALGPTGLQVVDFLMIFLLLGIIISYEDAIISFVGKTPFTTGSAAYDSVWTVLIIGPLSCVKEMRYLSKFSAMGIFAIFFAFAVIAGYGIIENGFVGFNQISWDDLWPSSIGAISNWFGCVVFGFGVVPITYNIQESMAEPQLMTRATEIALLGVFITYSAIGNGITILFSPSVPSFEGDVLEVLPNSWIPTAVRLSMTFVVIVTAPLLVVPCGELLEGKIGLAADCSFVLRAVIRLTICLFCTGVSVIVPGFVYVLSFVGSFCVALVSFIFPPLFHLLLLWQREEGQADTKLFASPQQLHDIGNGWSRSHTGGTTRHSIIYFDAALLCWGVIATAITSVFTFINLF